MEFKANLNRVHYLLTENFKNVELLEKSNLKLGNYIELSIKEEVECRIIIKKSDIESKNFDWVYLSDPLNENSKVERSSSVESFTEDIKEIIENKRFDSDYLKSIIEK